MADLRAARLEGVERRTLGNGLRVLVRRDASAPVAAVVTYVNAGYFDETDDVVGIAHVLEHMYFKGTPRRGVGEIARQTKAVGGYLNAATIYDHTLYYAVVPSSGFSAALDVQADAYRNSLIDAGELARELEVIIEEAKRKLDSPPAVAVETLYELLHDRHRIRRWRIGREDGLRKLTRDDVVGFYRNFYRPSTTILAIVGDLDPARTFKDVERLYGDLPPGEPRQSPGAGETNEPGFRSRELSGDVAQTQLALGWRTVGPLHTDAPALDVLASVLATGRASRLYRATRDRQLVSSISAYNYSPRDLGVFTIAGEAPPPKAAAALDATWDQLRRLRTDGVRADELERARRIIESRWVRRLEDMEGQANHLAEWESLSRWEFGDEYLNRLLSVSAADVTAAARRYLREDQVSVMVYRPRDAEPIAADNNALRTRLSLAPAAPLTPSAPQPPERAGGAPALSHEGEEAGVHIYRLKATGTPILVRRKAGSPIAYVGAFAVGGPSTESDAIGGRTLLMARSATKGTTTRDAVQIAEASEVLGGSVSAAVGGESLGWSISVPLAHVASAIELLADVVQRPSFGSDQLETERAIALADIATLRDDMYRYPMRLATRAAFGSHPYGISALGSDESMRTHTRDDVIAWHRQRFLQAPTVIAIVADGDPKDLASAVAARFDELHYTAPDPIAAPPWPARVVQSIENRDKAQTAMVLSWPSAARADAARFDAALLAGIASGLGGRLFEELRDKRSLCYTVHAQPSERRAAGTFSTYIATSPDKEAAARDALLAELGKFREDLVSPEELSRAQMYALGVHAIRQQSGAAVLGELVDAWLFASLNELTEFESCVRGVTAAGIREMARRYLDPDRRVEGIVRGATR